MAVEDKRKKPGNTDEYWQKYTDVLVRRFVFTIMALIIVLIVAIAFGTYQLRLLKGQVQIAGYRQLVVREVLSTEQIEKLKLALAPRDGRNGQNGTNGNNGVNGSDGRSVTSEQVAAGVAEYLKLNPPTAGVKGDAGVDGATQEIRVDPVTCQLQTKFSDADVWTILATLPRPCGEQ